jgi:exoribonuclease R
VRELHWKGRHAPEDGDWVVAEVPWEGAARLIEVLGAEDRPEWDEAAIVSQFRLRTHFPDEAEAEAAAHREPVSARSRDARTGARTWW